ALLPPWSVSASAQAAGLAAMEALTWREETLTMIWDASFSLRAALRTQGWQLHEASVPFFLLHAHHHVMMHHNAATLRAKLLQKGLVVRDCASFGLPEWVRIAPQQPKQNERLITALGELIEPDSNGICGSQ
ncbi:MAG: aminotransferase class I/II-fold pyridoxal phosphate-dependent enzyme, partial [Ardenticatenaceae bacterium]